MAHLTSNQPDGAHLDRPRDPDLDAAMRFYGGIRWR